MKDSEAQTIYRTYTKKFNFRIRCSLALSIILLFLPIHFLVKVALATVVFVLLVATTISTLKNKYLTPILQNELEPQIYRSLIYATNNNTNSAFDEVITAYLLNDYDAVVNICSAKLADEKYRRNPYLYWQYLARVYFDIGDVENLRAVCEDFERYISSKKNRKGLRRKAKIFLFFDYFLDGKFDECYSLYQSLYNDPKVCKTKLTRIQVGYLFAIACVKTNRIETAKEIFRSIATEAPNLNYGILSQKYLLSLDKGEEFAVETKKITPDESFVLQTPPKKARNKKAVVIVSICMVLLLGVSFKNSPHVPFVSIALNSSVAELLETIPLNAENDVLCLYKALDGSFSAAYLDGKSKNTYMYKTAVEHLTSGYSYSIRAADSDMIIHFAVFEAKSEIPAKAYASYAFETKEGTNYFCIKDIEQKEVWLYSTSLRLDDAQELLD